MLNFLKNRRLREQLRRMLKEARHVRNLREDISSDEDLQRLDQAILNTRNVLTSRNWANARTVAEALHRATLALCPPKRWPGWRENIEVLVVALAVAMAFRTYFIQPFKIPTSSMSPTLHGIHYVPREQPTILDRMPIKVVKWLIFGEWFVEARSQASGTVQVLNTTEGRIIVVQGIAHKIAPNMALRVSEGDRIVRGQLLASGIRIAGDHIFVNKLIWHFRRPQRGEIMVFKTTGIQHPQIKTNEHYVKRMVGLPGETIVFKTPQIYINGSQVLAPKSMLRIQECQPGYNGYQQMGAYIEAQNNHIVLGDDEYFACGDNQLNSLDSRYWGAVKYANLVGPAFWIYWPISKHWGPTK